MKGFQNLLPRGKLELAILDTLDDLDPGRLVRGGGVGATSSSVVNVKVKQKYNLRTITLEFSVIH